MTISRIDNVFLADTARVLGDVTLGEDVNIWYGAVVRGDVARITIGEATNVQDNAVLHCDSGQPLTIGPGVTIGHGAVVHGVSIGGGSLIGMGAVLLGGSRVGSGCIVAAGAVLAPGTVVEDGQLAMGVPARVARPINDDERAMLKRSSAHYVDLARRHCKQPDDPRVRPWGSRSG